MIFAKHYAAGTVSVAANATAVTGAGTFWSGAVRAGDILWIRGVSCRIASVDSATTLTLAQPWPGAAASGAYYEVWPVVEEVGYQRAVDDLVQMLANGDLAALGSLSSAADKLPYFTGPGAAALATFKGWARALLGITGTPGAKVPVVTGAATAVLRDIVGTVAQSGGVPTGALIEAGSNINGKYWRYAGGMQVAILRDITFAYGGTSELIYDWTYPASFGSEYPVCSLALQNSGVNQSNVSYSALGLYRHGDSATSATHIITRSAAAPNFASNAAVSGCRLLAIGGW